MSLIQDICQLLDEVLVLKGRGLSMTVDTPLLGAVPELDSMAVLALLTSMESRYGFAVSDDEIDGSVFATVGSLAAFIEAHQAA